jgi:hypothetical protein
MKLKIEEYVRSKCSCLLKKKKFIWQSPGDVKDETGSEIIAEQDQALQTKYLET